MSSHGRLSNLSHGVLMPSIQASQKAVTSNWSHDEGAAVVTLCCKCLLNEASFELFLTANV